MSRQSLDIILILKHYVHYYTVYTIPTLCHILKFKDVQCIQVNKGQSSVN